MDSALAPFQVSPESRAAVYAEAGPSTAEREAILNTFFKMRRPNEDINQSIRRNSSAQRTNSKRYQMGMTQNFPNDAEMNSFADAGMVTGAFEPDPNWQYMKFDSPGPYIEKAKAAGVDPYTYMIDHLKTAWGNEVNYDAPKKIGLTYFFPPRQTP